MTLVIVNSRLWWILMTVPVPVLYYLWSTIHDTTNNEYKYCRSTVTTYVRRSVNLKIVQILLDLYIIELWMFLLKIVRPFGQYSKNPAIPDFVLENNDILGVCRYQYCKKLSFFRDFINIALIWYFGYQYCNINIANINIVGISI